MFCTIYGSQLLHFKSNNQLITVPLNRAVAAEQQNSHIRLNIYMAPESQKMTKQVF